MVDRFNLREKEVISFVGGGGKTSSIWKMAKELAQDKKRVLCTTTTAIDMPSLDKCNIFIGEFPLGYSPENGTITVYGELERNGRLRNTATKKLEDIIAEGNFDYILIEADGARMKPVKAPADHEPEIISPTTITAGVIGLDSLGQKIEEAAHRPERLKKILSLSDNHIINYLDLLNLINHEEGLFKNSRGKKILLLNKVKSHQIEAVKKIKLGLIDKNIRVIALMWNK